MFEKRQLTKKEEELVTTKIIDFENQTGAELVLAIAKSSDPYPAAGLRIAIFLSFVLSTLLAYFIDFSFSFLYILIQFVLVFLIAPFTQIPWVKRLGLIDFEVEREVGEKALEIFYTKCSELSEHSNEALIYISQFERRIEVLVGKRLREKISQEQLDEVIQKIQSGYEKKHYLEANIHGIEMLQKYILEAFPDKVSQNHANDLSNQILWL